MSRISYIRKKKYENLSKGEIQYLRNKNILNGFGGASQSWLVRWLIGWILADFDSAIPDYHDFGYFIGGDEARRQECDEKFWRAMEKDIQKRYLNDEVTKWECVGKLIVSNLAYTAIRWKGSRFFNYL